MAMFAPEFSQDRSDKFLHWQGELIAGQGWYIVGYNTLGDE